MKPLLEIKSVPISIEYKLTEAKLERISDRMDLDINRKKGGFSMKSSPIKVNVDTFEARNSVSPTALTSVYQSAELGKKVVYNTIARFVNEGSMMLSSSDGGDVLTQIFEARVTENKQFELTFIPKHRASISWTPPNLEMEYELDKLTYNWQTNRGKFEFVPANIEFSIKEYPRVVIEYIGDPIYVPPSAAPGHEPVDIQT